MSPLARQLASTADRARELRAIAWALAAVVALHAADQYASLPAEYSDQWQDDGGEG